MSPSRGNAAKVLGGNYRKNSERKRFSEEEEEPFLERVVINRYHQPERIGKKKEKTPPMTKGPPSLPHHNCKSHPSY